MGKFEEAYKSLNSAQCQAVDAIDGPVLVIAGPGTGKTQLLSARVANILKRTDAYPDNVLCLTFTNKAADNMKQRLINLIGADALGIVVKTFHGLAADVMNRYPEYFWRGARLSIAPEAIQLEIMQSVLAGLPPDHPLALKFAGQFTLIDDATRAINLAKEAGLTPAKLRAIITANLEYIDDVEPLISSLGEFSVSQKTLPKIEAIISELPEQPINHLIAPLVSLQTVIKDSFATAMSEYQKTDKTTALSKWKARWLQKNDGVYGMFNERKRNTWWFGIADAYQHYRHQLHARSYYDYADMLVEVISQIEQREDLRASLQEQFQYVLIDEFQDTNNAQLRLAHLIADHADLEAPNIMAVGDDDQSIFKFQGAELSNMLGFTHQYPQSKLIVLTDNYRSTQTVLDNSGGIISHARYRMVERLPNLSKELKAASPPASKGKVVHQIFRSRDEQLSDLTETAGNLLSNGNTVAVLARRHNSLRDMAKRLHLAGIPIAYEQSNNILEQPAVEQLYIILKILVHIKKGEVSTTNELLCQTLRHPMWGIGSKELWEFAISQQIRHDWFTGLQTTGGKKLTAIGHWFDWLVSLSASEPAAVVVEYVLGLRDSDEMTSPIKAYFFSVPVSEAYVEMLSALQLLRALVSEFRSADAVKVEDFVSFIDLLVENHKIIADSSPFVSGDKRVELLTVHKAKGLEFDAVIVVDAVDQEWSPHLRGRLPPANLPLRPAEDDADDYVRLMYVAATRAKHTLLCGSYHTSLKGESVMPAMSLSQMPMVAIKPQTGNALIEVLEASLRWPALEQTDEKALLKPRLETYTMNVSNLINFLDVTKGGPNYFKERNLLRLPSAKAPAAAMGTAVHAALEEAQLRVNVGKFALEPVIKVFEDTLLNQALPESDYKKKLTEGRRALMRFIDKHQWTFTKGAHPEYELADVYCGQARLGGTLDVLDTTGKNICISDYKTGKPLSSLSIRAGTDGVRAWRHKLQLMFYSLLVELEPSVPVKGEVSGQMVYVEADSKNGLTIQYQTSKDDLTRLGTLVQIVWQHIMELSFPDTKDYSLDLKGVQAFEDDLLKGKI